MVLSSIDMIEKREASCSTTEEFVGTVDVWQLREMRWPIMRLLARRYVNELELHRYLARLLSTGRWSNGHAVPHPHAHDPEQHLFDVYGCPAASAHQASAPRRVTANSRRAFQRWPQLKRR